VGWYHEPKWDGFRFQIIKDGSDVRLYSRHGAEYTDRLPGMAEAFGKLPTRSAILDGELCLIDPRGFAHFYRLMAQMRASSPNESQLKFLAFDLLHQDGVDLRGLPLSERKLDLDRLCRQSKVPHLTRVETFPDGNVLFDYCNKFGFEGIVSKRRDSRYSSGPNRDWVKVKCPNWKRVNAERHKLFEDPRGRQAGASSAERARLELVRALAREAAAEDHRRALEVKEKLTRKRQELARVIERLRSPPLSHGIARELRKQRAILEREIAELLKTR
jgi:hypothetical protein